MAFPTGDRSCSLSPPNPRDVSLTVNLPLGNIPRSSRFWGGRAGLEPRLFCCFRTAEGVLETAQKTRISEQRQLHPQRNGDFSKAEGAPPLSFRGGTKPSSKERRFLGRNWWKTKKLKQCKKTTVGLTSGLRRGALEIWGGRVLGRCEPVVCV